MCVLAVFTGELLYMYNLNIMLILPIIVSLVLLHFVSCMSCALYGCWNVHTVDVVVTLSNLSLGSWGQPEKSSILFSSSQEYTLTKTGY